MKQILIAFFLLAGNYTNVLFAQSTSGQRDSLTLAQAYINLTLTTEYYDSVSSERLTSILSYEDDLLQSIKHPSMINDGKLLLFTKALWHYLDARKRLNSSKKYNREILTNLKGISLESIDNFNSADGIKFIEDSPFYANIEFEEGAVSRQKNRIFSLKSRLSELFCEDIYPDYQRIFLTAQNEDIYYFDSLKYYNALYSIPFSLDILNSEEQAHLSYEGSISNQFYFSNKDLDLISRYMQLDYIANGHKKHIDTIHLYEGFRDFKRDLNTRNRLQKSKNKPATEDVFFTTYLSEEKCNILYDKIKERYPVDYLTATEESHGYNQNAMVSHYHEKYYFPLPAPFTKTKLVQKKYKPQLITLGQVCNYMESCFFQAGYKDHLNYYYLKKPGFAIASDIERINKDGSPAPESERWDLKQQRVTWYSAFEAIFFETESNFRIIVCVISAKEYLTSSQPSSFYKMSENLNKSYSVLPEDLENNKLNAQTITILVYHFTQHDVGKVPVINLNTNLSARKHLEMTTGLLRLISN